MKHTQLSDTYTVLLGGLHLLYETVLYFKIELWSLYVLEVAVKSKFSGIDLRLLHIFRAYSRTKFANVAL